MQVTQDVKIQYNTIHFVLYKYDIRTDIVVVFVSAGADAHLDGILTQLRQLWKHLSLDHYANYIHMGDELLEKLRWQVRISSLTRWAGFRSAPFQLHSAPLPSFARFLPFSQFPKSSTNHQLPNSPFLLLFEEEWRQLSWPQAFVGSLLH